MRLMDCVTAAAADVQVYLPAKGVYRLPGAGRFTETLARTPVRYVLHDCMTVLLTRLSASQLDLIGKSVAAIRLPYQDFWVEWRENLALRR